MLKSFLLAGLTTLALISPTLADPTKLEKIHRTIIQDHPEVKHLTRDEFTSLSEASAHTVVLDIREKEEFEVGHLSGAIQVDPEISADQFNQQFGSLLANKTVVLYCSVGRRASALAERLQENQKIPDMEIYNLRHGIFGWHNDQRSLYIDKIKTPYVHPYSWRWKHLLQYKDLSKYEPDPDIPKG